MDIYKKPDRKANKMEYNTSNFLESWQLNQKIGQIKIYNFRNNWNKTPTKKILTGFSLSELQITIWNYIWKISTENRYWQVL